MLVKFFSLNQIGQFCEVDQGNKKSDPKTLVQKMFGQKNFGQNNFWIKIRLPNTNVGS